MDVSHILYYRLSEQEQSDWAKIRKSQKAKWIFTMTPWSRTGNRPSPSIPIPILIILAKIITVKGMKAKEESELHYWELHAFPALKEKLYQDVRDIIWLPKGTCSRKTAPEIFHRDMLEITPRKEAGYKFRTESQLLVLFTGYLINPWWIFIFCIFCVLDTL